MMKWSDLRRLDGYLPVDMEKAYRQHYLRADVRMATIALSFFSFLLVAFAFNDYVLFGFTSAFYLLISLRGLYLAYFIWLTIFIHRNKSPARYDWNLFVGVIAGFVLIAIINLTRPAGYAGNFAVDTIVILVLYLGVPMRLGFRGVGGLSYTVGEVLNFIIFRPLPSEAAVYAAIIVLVIANALGIFASSRLYSFRRSEFQARHEQERATVLLQETGRTARVGGWEFDVGTNVQRWTDEVYRIHELPLDHQPTVEEGINYYAPEAVPVIRQAVERAIESGEPFDLELPFITAKGKHLWVHAIGRGFRKNGKVIKVGGTFQDITDRKMAQEKVRQEAEQWQTTFDTITDAISIQDSDFKLVRVNKAYAGMFKMKPEELIGKDCFQIVHGATCPIDNCPQKKALLSNKSITEDIFEPRLGIYMEVSCSPIVTEGEVRGTVHIIKDITDRMEFQKKLADAAMHDALTSLPNRSLLYDRFTIARGQAERNNRKMALLELDLDRFKDVNDSLGHAVGDELLKATGQRLTGITRQSDTVARLGGDEFAILVPEIANTGDAIAAARKILETFKQPVTIDGNQLTVTTSIGIAIYPDNGQSIEEMLQSADKAMYYVKEHGRNSFRLFDGQTES
jgi:diguanylate cyclase (GGDEF)-like protein/PAS domain S-box-containing protein